MKAIVKIQPFAFKQKVFINEESYDVTIEDMPKFLMDFNQLKEIHIFGNQDYIKQIELQIKQSEFAKYKHNDIKFYLNK
jgi:hypothetical protein